MSGLSIQHIYLTNHTDYILTALRLLLDFVKFVQ